MPRILMLASALSIHTARWADALANRGYDIYVVSREPIGVPFCSTISHYLLPFSSSWGIFANGIWTRRLITQIKPDLVHAHYATSYGTIAALAGFHPTLLSVWGSDIYNFPKKSFLHKYLLEFNLQQADKVLSTSYAMAKEANKYVDRLIEITPFGVDTEQFKPLAVQTPFAPSDIVIGTVKSLEEGYGIKHLIQAFYALKNKYSNLPIKLLIVGGGSQHDLLRSMVYELELEHDCIFTGRVQHDEVPVYQNMLSVAVFASIHAESFGVAVLEASACEKPVVVSNIGGLPEVVEDGVSGFTVQPGNVEQIVNALEKLVLDPSMRAIMGKAGRERVKRLFEWQDNVNRMVDIYQTIL